MKTLCNERNVRGRKKWENTKKLTNEILKAYSLLILYLFRCPQMIITH